MPWRNTTPTGSRHGGKIFTNGPCKRRICAKILNFALPQAAAAAAKLTLHQPVESSRKLPAKTSLPLTKIQTLSMKPVFNQLDRLTRRRLLAGCTALSDSSRSWVWPADRSRPILKGSIQHMRTRSNGGSIAHKYSPQACAEGMLGAARGVRV